MSNVRINERIELDPDALTNEINSRNGAPARILAGLASWATRNARDLARSRITPRTGEYIRGIGFQISQGASGPVLTMRADAGHSMIIELGSRPHVIRARREGGFLRWTDSQGRVRFAREVQHPGTEAQHIMGDTLQGLSGVFDRIAAAEADTT